MKAEFSESFCDWKYLFTLMHGGYLASDPESHNVDQSMKLVFSMIKDLRIFFSKNPGIT